MGRLGKPEPEFKYEIKWKIGVQFHLKNRFFGSALEYETIYAAENNFNMNLGAPYICS